MQPADVFVIVATLLAWTTLVPQIVKLARTGDPKGISATWPFIGLVTNSAWTTYLASQGLWAAIPAASGMVFFYVLVIRYLRRAHVPLGRPLARGIGLTALLTGIGSVLGWGGLGLVLGWSYIVQMSPAVWSTYRVPNPTGVSISSWSLITIESGLWSIYGWLQSDTPIVIFGLTGFIAGLAIVLRALATRGVDQGELVPPITPSEGRL